MAAEALLVADKFFHISPRKCLEILLVANANSILSCKKEFPKTRKLFNLFVIKKFKQINSPCHRILIQKFKNQYRFFVILAAKLGNDIRF